jgi:hypothetical protein
MKHSLSVRGLRVSVLNYLSRPVHFLVSEDEIIEDFPRKVRNTTIIQQRSPKIIWAKMTEIIPITINRMPIFPIFFLSKVLSQEDYC